MTAERIAVALGGHRAGRGWVCRCVAHQDADPSLSLRDAADGKLLVHCFANCDPRDVLEALRRLGLLDDDRRRDELPRVHRPKVDPPDQAHMLEWAARLWAESLNPRGTVVEAYLASRALELGDDVAGRVLRFHPALKPSKDIDPDPPGPTLIAAFTDLRTDIFTGISRIFLTSDGRKRFPKDDPRHRPNKAFAGKVAGAAVKIDAASKVSRDLVVGEGVETAMAGRRLGYTPIWAVGSAWAIASLPVLPGVARLTILGESDPNGTSAAAAEGCARRWNAAGVTVEVVMPTAPGQDANDVLIARSSR